MLLLASIIALIAYIRGDITKEALRPYAKYLAIPIVLGISAFLFIKFTDFSLIKLENIELEGSYKPDRRSKKELARLGYNADCILEIKKDGTFSICAISDESPLEKGTWNSLIPERNPELTLSDGQNQLTALIDRKLHKYRLKFDFEDQDSSKNLYFKKKRKGFPGKAVQSSL